MNRQDALARQRSLREGQNFRAGITGGAVDRDRLSAVATEDGVPERYSRVGRIDFGKESAAYAAITKAIDAMVSDDGKDGLVVYGSSDHYAPRVAGAMYTGAMVRGLAARWYNFPELADHFSRKISLDRSNEWDVGEVVSWNDDLDSARYCYDLVVLHGFTQILLNPYVSSEVYKIVASRAVRGLFTVITLQSAEEQLDIWEGCQPLKLLLDQQFYMHAERVV
jgi:hypothetical protein